MVVSAPSVPWLWSSRERRAPVSPREGGMMSLCQCHHGKAGRCPCASVTTGRQDDALVPASPREGRTMSLCQRRRGKAGRCPWRAGGGERLWGPSRAPAAPHHPPCACAPLAPVLPTPLSWATHARLPQLPWEPMLTGDRAPSPRGGPKCRAP